LKQQFGRGLKGFFKLNRSSGTLFLPTDQIPLEIFDLPDLQEPHKTSVKEINNLSTTMVKKQAIL